MTISTIEDSSFWKDVDAFFNNTELALQGLSLPTAAELHRHWASFGSSEFQSSLRERLEVAYTLYPVMKIDWMRSHRR